MKVITNTETVSLGKAYRVPKPENGKLRYYIDGKGASLTGIEDVDKAYDEIIKASMSGKEVVDLRDKPTPKPKVKPEPEVKTEVVDTKQPETKA